MKKAIGIVAAASLFICGCGNPAPNEVINMMNESIQSISDYEAEVTLKIDLDYGLEGINDNLALEYREDIEVDVYENLFYAGVSYNIEDAFGEEWQSYIIKDGNDYSSYICEYDEWYWDMIDSDEAELMTGGVFGLLAALDYTRVNGNAYKLSAELSSDEADELLRGFNAAVINDAFGEEADLSSISGVLELNIDRKTYLPESISIIFDDCSDMFLEKNIFDEAAINEFSFTVKFTGYDTDVMIFLPTGVSEKFEIPEDMYDDAPEYFDEDVEADDEGKYELYDYQELKKVTLPAPEGFTLNSESSNTMLSFDSINNDAGSFCTVVYEFGELNSFYTKSDIKGHIESMYNFYSTDEAYMNMELYEAGETAVGEFTVGYSGMGFYLEDDGNYYQMYNFWSFFDSNVITCSFVEYGKNPLEAADAKALANKFYAGLEK